MGAETKRLREPAAWGLIGYVAVGLGVTATRVFFGAGTSVSGYRARSYAAQADLLHVMTPFLLVAAVLLATHAGRPIDRARAVTRAALGVLAAQALVGVTAALSALAYHGNAYTPVPSSARVQQTILNVVVLCLFALAAYFFLMTLSVPNPPTVTRGRVPDTVVPPQGVQQPQPHMTAQTAAAPAPAPTPASPPPPTGPPLATTVPPHPNAVPTRRA
ncbi:hypothetical protein [Yinghuangia seranimata]|uniref:hypothetical protein n=1 Tax=Yinghuangia seranimata TaxID=408067 RepID=UPI00248C6B89|nr:hypothetical protein [Yinghuangia seranimata]MDI2130965.1 hypothetical protein [Yinghuangia seranimata]